MLILTVAGGSVCMKGFQQCFKGPARTLMETWKLSLSTHPQANTKSGGVSSPSAKVLLVRVQVSGTS